MEVCCDLRLDVFFKKIICSFSNDNILKKVTQKNVIKIKIIGFLFGEKLKIQNKICQWKNVTVK